MTMTKTVLIVDDDVSIREMLVKLFSREQYTVLTAEGAREALRALKEHQVPVMFLDLNLPGMNGTDLCREIKQEYPMACVFAVTGHRSLFELADCRDAGFEDYFTKPVEPALLLDAAKRAFERHERWRSI
jgi:DNA-binding NtrC family response regulator